MARRLERDSHSQMHPGIWEASGGPSPVLVLEVLHIPVEESVERAEARYLFVVGPTERGQEGNSLDEQCRWGRKELAYGMPHVPRGTEKENREPSLGKWVEGRGLVTRSGPTSKERDCRVVRDLHLPLDERHLRAVQCQSLQILVVRESSVLEPDAIAPQAGFYPWATEGRPSSILSLQLTNRPRCITV